MALLFPSNIRLRFSTGRALDQLILIITLRFTKYIAMLLSNISIAYQIAFFIAVL